MREATGKVRSSSTKKERRKEFVERSCERLEIPLRSEERRRSKNKGSKPKVNMDSPSDRVIFICPY